MSATPISVASPAWAALLVAACVALFLFEATPLRPHADDAFISYRYARNLVEGHGLVYNPGEYVEGYTNPLWTLGVAAGLALGAEARPAGQLLGAIGGAATLLFGWLYARALLPPSAAGLAALAPWLVLASAPFGRWATSGMETPLFAAAATAALLAQARGRAGWTALAAGVATLTRPEGALLAGVLFAFHLVVPARGTDAQPAPPAWRPVLAYAALLVALTAFRLAYYGAPLPNTFYAKVGGVPPVLGAWYAVAFLADGPGLLLVPAAFAARDPRVRAGLVFAAAMLAYVVAVGGDSLGLGRLLVPVLPALAALSLAGVAAAWRVRRPLGAALAFLLPVALWAEGLGGPVAGFRALLDPEQPSKRARLLQTARAGDALFERMGRERARVLRRRGDPDPLVATGAIGALGYFARVPILDILGLVDATIARSEPVSGAPGVVLPGHQRAATDYVFDREPDYIVVARRGAPGKGRLPAVAGIWAHPELERSYVWDAELRAYARTPQERPGARAAVDRDAATRAPQPPASRRRRR